MRPEEIIDGKKFMGIIQEKIDETLNRTKKESKELIDVSINRDLARIGLKVSRSAVSQIPSEKGPITSISAQAIGTAEQVIRGREAVEQHFKAFISKEK